MTAMPLSIEDLEAQLLKKEGELRALRQLRDQILERSGPPAPAVERIERAIASRGNQSMSVAQIARLTRMPQSSVRVYLYSNKDRFDAIRESPRRIRWRVIDTQP